MTHAIKMSTIMDLCSEAGLDGNDIFMIQISPDQAIFDSLKERTIVPIQLNESVSE